MSFLEIGPVVLVTKKMADAPYRLFQERITRTPGGFREPSDPENEIRFGRLESINPGLKVVRETLLNRDISLEQRKMLNSLIEEWKKLPDNYIGVSRDAPPGTISHEAGHNTMIDVIKSLLYRQRDQLGAVLPPGELDSGSDEVLTRAVADPLNYSSDRNQIVFDTLRNVLSQGSTKQQKMLNQLIRLRQQGQAAKSQNLYNYIPIGIPSSQFPPARNLK